MITYTNLKNAHLRNIGTPDVTDVNILADFNYNLGLRYQLIWGNISSYINQENMTTSTVAAQQYYGYPQGLMTIDNLSITIGSVTYSLTPIYDQAIWNQLNALQIQPSAIPQYYLSRKDDFGIWPIPQDVYTINSYSFQRDRNLTIEDVTTGTVTVTNGDATVTSNTTPFVADMVGRYFSVTSAVPGHGRWYKIASFTSTSVLELNMPWDSTTAAGASYVIGECPELPEEAHILLPDGTAADFYSGLRSNVEKATWFNNKFWTGDGNNPNRTVSNENIRAGLIGLINNYKSRDKSSLVYRMPGPISPFWKVYATTLS
jgi:hypothetical protein